MSSNTTPSPAATVTEEIVPVRKPKGFAAISPERVREIASKGGKAAHAVGTAHKFTTEEAKAAGRKGGLARGKRRKPDAEAGQ